MANSMIEQKQEGKELEGNMMAYGELELITVREDERPTLRRFEEVLNDEDGFPESAHHSLPKLVSPGGETIEMPLSIFRVLQQVVGYMMRGKAFRMIKC